MEQSQSISVTEGLLTKLADTSKQANNEEKPDPLRWWQKEDWLIIDNVLNTVAKALRRIEREEKAALETSAALK